MPPQFLRAVISQVTQGVRSTVSSRNFSSFHGRPFITKTTKRPNRKLSNFYGDLPIPRLPSSSHIPYLLSLERRLDVTLVRLHFVETIPQARQLVSHGKVCVNKVTVGIGHYSVKCGDIISLNEQHRFDSSIRRFFYKKVLVEEMIGRLVRPARMGLRSKGEWLRTWERSKAEWFRLLQTERGRNLLLKSRVLSEFRLAIEESDLARNKKLGSGKLCLGSSISEYNRIRQNFLKSLCLSVGSKASGSVNRNVYSNSVYWFSSPDKRPVSCRRISLPTHYLEVNYRTGKAVVYYVPNTESIPHGIRKKDLNLLLWSQPGRSRNVVSQYAPKLF